MWSQREPQPTPTQARGRGACALGATALALALALALGVCLTSSSAWSLGKRPLPPGGPLTAGLDKALISAGHCQASRECFEKLPFAAEHGVPVRVRFFNVNDKNFAALLTAIGFMARQALQQPDRVPADLEAFRESEVTYQASGAIFGRVKPFLTMTVTP